MNVVYQVCECKDEPTDDNKSIVRGESQQAQGPRHLSPSSFALRVFSVGFQLDTPVDSVVPVRKMEDTSYPCSACHKTLNSRWGIRRHMRDVHGETEGSISRLEENCDFKCHYVKQLRVHLSTTHSLDMRVEEKSFKCEEGC